MPSIAKNNLAHMSSVDMLKIGSYDDVRYVVFNGYKNTATTSTSFFAVHNIIHWKYF